MGKNSLVVIFLLLLAGSIYVYQSRDTRNLRENLEGEEETMSRIEFENLGVYQYQGARLTSSLSAKRAAFFEPNVLDMAGQVTGMRFGEKGVESVNAESAQIFFAAKGVSQIMKDTTVEKAELSNDVQVVNERYKLRTHYAEYIHSLDMLRSDMPIDVVGANHSLHGQKGFQYLIGKQNLQIRGPINGVVKNLEGT